MAKEQGVWQLWPVEVLASAPAGCDSNWMLTGAGSNFGHQSGFAPPDAQPARARPEAMITMTWRMSVRSIQRREAVFPGFQTCRRKEGRRGHPLSMAAPWAKFPPAS